MIREDTTEPPTLTTRAAVEAEMHLNEDCYGLSLSVEHRGAGHSLAPGRYACNAPNKGIAERALRSRNLASLQLQWRDPHTTIMTGALGSEAESRSKCESSNNTRPSVRKWKRTRVDGISARPLWRTSSWALTLVENVMQVRFEVALAGSPHCVLVVTFP
eukprot:231567-Amphidinium_carterae.1